MYQVTKTFTLNPGALRQAGMRKGMAGLLIASLFMAVSAGARADAFGSGGGVQLSLVERLAALEKELKELKEKGGPVSPAATVASPSKATAAAKPNLTLPPPMPGLEGLPGGGADERERLLVEKELTYEVVGTVNDQLLVREGDRRFLLTAKEFKAFEKEKRQKAVRKLKVQAVSDGDAAKLSFPQLQPPAPEPVSTNTLTQAGQALDQARAIEANGGQPPAAPAKPANPTPAKPAAAPATVPGQARPASPVVKN